MNCKFTLLLLISITKISYSQKTEVGITAGVTVANVQAKADNESETADSKIGFTAGLFLQTSISKKVFFAPAINFVQKGFSAPDMDPGESDKSTLNYLEVPLNVIFKSEGFSLGLALLSALGYQVKRNTHTMAKPILMIFHLGVMRMKSNRLNSPETFWPATSLKTA